jgi:hypothetical protein
LKDGGRPPPAQEERGNVEDHPTLALHAHVVERDVHQAPRRCWMIVSARFTTNDSASLVEA